MQISEVLSLDCTKSAVQCTSKKRALEMISQIAADHTGQNATELFESMLNREKMGSTGIGNGIAIPHARMTSTDEAVAVLLQCKDPIEFDAIDNRPVDLLFALLVPDAQCKEHLKTLSSMAERMNDKKILKLLRHAESDQELFDIMINGNES
ncbi:PTS IIA-like nitrogen-regulatory protein PtsN [Vibrio sp. HA2012]|uniref:PTS IIA-like nitrogen regulatory protein PtsN n=1 Tax=Vibrio sp. HA2012 TaxID=1971595 RepID=UPI000C2B8B23|nr:PTS IIA-like nitrogen regulatory protein PtsN [Vibrio sp. HA2012]PJC85893.1 PTS IIA-like nitrogen-regulatory protein PtsN [Vibrio sp. HA2012]